MSALTSTVIPGSSQGHQPADLEGRCETCSTGPMKVQRSKGPGGSPFAQGHRLAHSYLSQALQPILDRGDETATPHTLHAGVQHFQEVRNDFSMPL